MPHRLMTIALVLCVLNLDAQKAFRYSVDLTAIKEDRLQVEVEIPAIKSKEILFRLPRMVPGIYGELDFGKNLVSIDAFDASGKKQEVTKVDPNSWLIKQDAAVTRISYSINDDWEDFAEYEKLVYRSPGSSFLRDSFFLINHNSIFGYVEGWDRAPVEVTFTKPPGFFAATSLEKDWEKGNTIHFKAGNYHQLVDNPVLFSRPDTAMINLDGVPVLVACYSTSGKAIASNIASEIRPLLHHQKAYLGGKLPVNRYTFIIFHHSGADPRSSFGDGLEHAQSTVILSNMYLDPAAISRNVYGIASHEFFHTIMPLALHSEEISAYDFNMPQMSQHLWLYEGMTEYFTIHMPVKQGLQKPEEFAKTIEEKIGSMMMLDSNLSLTTLSRKVIGKQDQYMNVYARGALVNLCLDIYLREMSNGKYGVQEMVRDLVKRYGKKKPFKDDELFAAMEKVSNQPALKDFIDLYIDGNSLPPLAESLAKVGFILTDHYEVKLNPSPTKEMVELRKWWIGR